MQLNQHVGGQYPRRSRHTPPLLLLHPNNSEKVESSWKRNKVPIDKSIAQAAVKIICALEHPTESDLSMRGMKGKPSLVRDGRIHLFMLLVLQLKIRNVTQFVWRTASPWGLAATCLQESAQRRCRSLT